MPGTTGHHCARKAWKTAVNPPACKREQENMLLAIEESLITKYNVKGIDYSLRARHYGK